MFKKILLPSLALALTMLTCSVDWLYGLTDQQLNILEGFFTEEPFLAMQLGQGTLTPHGDSKSVFNLGDAVDAPRLEAGFHPGPFDLVAGNQDKQMLVFEKGVANYRIRSQSGEPKILSWFVKTAYGLQKTITDLCGQIDRERLAEAKAQQTDSRARIIGTESILVLFGEFLSIADQLKRLAQRAQRAGAAGLNVDVHTELGDASPVARTDLAGLLRQIDRVLGVMGKARDVEMLGKYLNKFSELIFNCKRLLVLATNKSGVINQELFNEMSTISSELGSQTLDLMNWFFTYSWGEHLVQHLPARANLFRPWKTVLGLLCENINYKLKKPEKGYFYHEYYDPSYIGFVTNSAQLDRNSEVNRFKQVEANYKKSLDNRAQLKDNLQQITAETLGQETPDAVLMAEHDLGAELHQDGKNSHYIHTLNCGHTSQQFAVMKKFLDEYPLYNALFEHPQNLNNLRQCANYLGFPHPTDGVLDFFHDPSVFRCAWCRTLYDMISAEPKLIQACNWVFRGATEYDFDGDRTPYANNWISWWQKDGQGFEFNFGNPGTLGCLTAVCSSGALRWTGELKHPLEVGFDDPRGYESNSGRYAASGVDLFIGDKLLPIFLREQNLNDPTQLTAQVNTLKIRFARALQDIFSWWKCIPGDVKSQLLGATQDAESLAASHSRLGGSGVKPTWPGEGGGVGIVNPLKAQDGLTTEELWRKRTRSRTSSPDSKPVGPPPRNPLETLRRNIPPPSSPTPPPPPPPAAADLRPQAASTIQRAWRGHQGRKEALLRQAQQLLEQAQRMKTGYEAKLAQPGVDGSRLGAVLGNAASVLEIMIERLSSASTNTRVPVQKLIEDAVKEINEIKSGVDEAMRQHEAAIQIQKAGRGWLARKDLPRRRAEQTPLPETPASSRPSSPPAAESVSPRPGSEASLGQEKNVRALEAEIDALNTKLQSLKDRGSRLPTRGGWTSGSLDPELAGPPGASAVQAFGGPPSIPRGRLPSAEGIGRLGQGFGGGGTTSHGGDLAGALGRGGFRPQVSLPGTVGGGSPQGAANPTPRGRAQGLGDSVFGSALTSDLGAAHRRGGFGRLTQHTTASAAARTRRGVDTSPSVNPGHAGLHRDIPQRPLNVPTGRLPGQRDPLSLLSQGPPVSH